MATGERGFAFGPGVPGEGEGLRRRCFDSRGGHQPVGAGQQQRWVSQEVSQGAAGTGLGRCGARSRERVATDRWRQDVLACSRGQETTRGDVRVGLASGHIAADRRGEVRIPSWVRLKGGIPDLLAVPHDPTQTIADDLRPSGGLRIQSGPASPSAWRACPRPSKAQPGSLFRTLPGRPIEMGCPSGYLKGGPASCGVTALHCASGHAKEGIPRALFRSLSLLYTGRSPLHNA